MVHHQEFYLPLQKVYLYIIVEWENLNLQSDDIKGSLRKIYILFHNLIYWLISLSD
jgi:hypothetical protein